LAPRALRPTLTLRQHLQIAANVLSVPLKLSVVPGWVARPLGLFIPIVREGIEMQFLFDRPYIVNSAKFRARFWSDVVPFKIGLSAATLSFRPPAACNRAAISRSVQPQTRQT
jgi:hypothetical protein